MVERKIFREGNETILSGFETDEDVTKHLKMLQKDPRFEEATKVNGEIHLPRGSCNRTAAAFCPEDEKGLR